MKFCQNNHLLGTWCYWKISMIELKLWILYYFEFLRVSNFFWLRIYVVLILLLTSMREKFSIDFAEGFFVNNSIWAFLKRGRKMVSFESFFTHDMNCLLYRWGEKGIKNSRFKFTLSLFKSSYPRSWILYYGGSALW